MQMMHIAQASALCSEHLRKKLRFLINNQWRRRERILENSAFTFKTHPPHRIFLSFKAAEW